MTQFHGGAAPTRGSPSRHELSVGYRVNHRLAEPASIKTGQLTAQADPPFQSGGSLKLNLNGSVCRCPFNSERFPPAVSQSRSSLWQHLLPLVPNPSSKDTGKAAAAQPGMHVNSKKPVLKMTLDNLKQVKACNFEAFPG